MKIEIQQLISNLNKLDPTTVSVNDISHLLENFEWRMSPADSFRFKKQNSEYSKAEFKSNFFNVCLIEWSEKATSAIHQHKGFWGMVKILQGSFLEHQFDYDEKYNCLSLQEMNQLEPNQIALEEIDGIHMITHTGLNSKGLTLHIYNPKVSSFDGTMLFDLQSRTLGVLNDRAKSATWSNPRKAFKRIERNGFEFRLRALAQTG